MNDRIKNREHLLRFNLATIQLMAADAAPDVAIVLIDLADKNGRSAFVGITMRTNGMTLQDAEALADRHIADAGPGFMATAWVVMPLEAVRDGIAKLMSGSTESFDKVRSMMTTNQHMVVVISDNGTLYTIA